MRPFPQREVQWNSQWQSGDIKKEGSWKEVIDSTRHENNKKQTGHFNILDRWKGSEN